MRVYLAGPPFADEYRRRAGITQETGTHVDTTRPDGVAHTEETP